MQKHKTNNIGKGTSESNQDRPEIDEIDIKVQSENNENVTHLSEVKSSTGILGNYSIVNWAKSWFHFGPQVNNVQSLEREKDIDNNPMLTENHNFSDAMLKTEVIVAFISIPLSKSSKQTPLL